MMKMMRRIFPLFAVLMVLFTVFPGIGRAVITDRSPVGLLSYFQTIDGNHSISGEMIEMQAYPVITTIHNQTGKWVGLIGGDYWHFGGTGNVVSGYPFNASAVDYWNSGGLITLISSIPNPTTGGYSGDVSALNATDLLTNGTATNTAFMSYLDGIANGLQQLKNSGVTVIYRPYHENNGNWFWWGTSRMSDAQFVAMWQFTYNYFKNTKGLNNLIWQFSVNAGISSSFPMNNRYPGNAYVDMTGLDGYTNSPAGLQGDYNTLIALGKPYALSEFGSGDPNSGNSSFNQQVLTNAIKQQMPRTLFWQQWWDTWGMDRMQNVTAALSDPFILNRDDLGTGAQTGTGTFEVRNGRVFSPTGAAFTGSGMNVGGEAQQYVATNNACQPLTTLFPGINVIRLNTGSNAPGSPSAVYPDASFYQQMIERCTGYTRQGNGSWLSTSNQHIVVILEDHDGNRLDPPFTGQALTQQTNWYTAMATYFSGNPWVHYGTQNEMNTGDRTYSQSAFAAMTNSHVAIYNAVRAGSSKALVIIMAGAGGSNPGTVGFDAGYPRAPYLAMRNIMFEIHPYYSNGEVLSQNGVVYATTAAQNLLGGTFIPNAGTNAGWGIAGAQTLQSADGIVPVLAGEWGGNGGNPAGTDVSEMAAQLKQAAHTGTWQTAWQWSPNGGADNAAWDIVNGGLSSNPTRTGWGNVVADVIADNAATQNGPTITAPSSVVAQVSTTTSISGISMTDVANPGDTMTFTGTTTGLGSLSASGATGNGTSRITASGSLSAINTLLGTITFQDGTAENVTLAWTVQDGHSNSASTTTLMGVISGSISPNCTVVNTVGPLITSTGPPTATWGLTSGGQVITNGVTDQTTANATQIVYIGTTVYHQNTALNWYSKMIPADTWTQTTDPTAVCQQNAITVTWNPSDVAASMTLTNSNLTATTTTTGSASVRANTAASGKVCWEITATTISANWDIGLSNSTYSLTAAAGLGGDNMGIGFDPNAGTGIYQATFFNNATLGAFGGSASANGDAFMQCADTAAQLLWTKDSVMTGAGNTWNNSPTANPATGVGGNSFGGMSGPYFVTYNNFDSGAVAVLNARGPFQASVPSGFTPLQNTMNPTVQHPFMFIFSENDKPVSNDNRLYGIAN